WNYGVGAIGLGCLALLPVVSLQLPNVERMTILWRRRVLRVEPLLAEFHFVVVEKEIREEPPFFFVLPINTIPDNDNPFSGIFRHLYNRSDFAEIGFAQHFLTTMACKLLDYATRQWTWDSSRCANRRHIEMALFEFLPAAAWT